MTRIAFPAGEFMVQSRYLYLQSVGSTSADGSAFGAHIRWLLTRNLGDTHLPKGDFATTSVNFNRRDDYVTLFRSRYVERHPAIIDFSIRPNLVHDALAMWVYVDPRTGTVMYIRFRDEGQYATVRGRVDPNADPQEFVRQYCPSLIEAELPDKLFFAVEVEAARDPFTVMRAEALSVEANEPLSPLFVSCRKTFTNATWCPPPPAPRPRRRPVEPRSSAASSNDSVAQVTFRTGEPPCIGPNLLPNGGFEQNPAVPPFAFETDYRLQQGVGVGIINVVSDPRTVNGSWTGSPHSGDAFLAVDGVADIDIVRLRVHVKPRTTYSLSGWLSTLYSGDVSIPLEFRIAAAGAVQTFRANTPAKTNVWEPFTFAYESGNVEVVTISIVTLSARSVGNDFGLDDLTFCETARQDCRARLASESIRSVRFDLHDGYPTRLFFETYDDYILAAEWELLDRFALTPQDVPVLSRLESSPGSVHARWLKFNEHALLNLDNYRHRWLRTGGLKEGVQRYIALSETDPSAIAALTGANAEDGSVTISMLEALQLVSLDFHVARMFGLGHLDMDIEGDTTAYIYLGMYDTEGELDDAGGKRRVRHYYMGVPTRPLDHRLPPSPILRPVTYGLTVDHGEPEPASLTDPTGYTPDGQSRYVNIFVEPETDSASLSPFFIPPDEFCAIDHTSSVFYGVEYRKQGEIWRRPEIAHDQNYRDMLNDFETLPLPNNASAAIPVLRHEERENGLHEYGGYGINWFSRASAVGNVVATNPTLIRKAARLLPPANFAVQLIERESPLLLTTTAEQTMLGALTGDKLLVRVTFDYHHVHDINYAFASQVELFFRSEMPRNVVGALKSVTNAPGNSRQCVVRTMPYPLHSTGTVITPVLAPSLFPNFLGGVLTVQQENYVIVAVTASTVAGEGPMFTIAKNVKSNATDPGGIGAYVTVNEYLAPQITSNEPSMFMAVENMADAASWGTPNPLAKVISILPGSAPHTETIVQGGETRAIKVRGIRESAQVTAQGQGVFTIQFTSALAHHPQHADADPVDWYKGVVRIATTADPNGPKKVLDVLIAQHIGDGQPLTLHVHDDDPSTTIQTGPSVMVNYYPGYRVYLHADSTHGFESAAILPVTGEGLRKTWLGAHSVDTVEHYSSPVGIPAPIIAVERIEPFAPGLPRGADYATWPDFYFKSSYTFVVDFQHEPYSMAMYRSNDTAILRALFKDATYQSVREQLAILGEDDPHRADRWRNLLSFDYVYDVASPDHPFFDPTGSSPNGTFRKFSAAPDGYAFPNPDKPGIFTGAAPGTILPALRDAIYGTFTALTELPLIYQNIKGPSHEPVPKPQNIRNAQGTLLDPADPAFDIAPMAKRTGNPNEIQFTDFTLDGTSNNIFFYCGREIGNRGRLGDPGPIAGPVVLINTRPPEAPAIKRMYVVEPDVVTGTGPAVQFEVNAYPAVQKVHRMLIYRATEPENALSVRTMELVNTLDLEDSAQEGALAIQLADNFQNSVIPYGDPLYYRIVAMRKVKKPDGGTQWAPSKASKLLLTIMIDTVNPEPPQITFISDGLSGAPAVLTNVILSWKPAAYNGTYYLEKMTRAGAWQTIHTIERVNAPMSVNLAATALGTNILPKENADEGRTIYNRFRVRVQNSSGLFNLRDNVLTL